MQNFIKTAISLPTDTYRRAEALRRKAGKSRSELYASAIEALLSAIEVRESDARYEDGYRAKPETARERADAQAFLKAGLPSLDKEDW